MFKIILYLIMSLLIFSVVAQEKKSVGEVIPVTVSNMKGHQFLYNEGWYVVTSTKKSLDFAYEKMVKESGESMKEMSHDSVHAVTSLGERVKSNAASSIQDSKGFHKKGSELASDLRAAGNKLSRDQYLRSKEGFKSAWESFALGYIGLASHTKDEWAELKASYSAFGESVKDDFSDLNDWFNSQGATLSTKAESSWGESFAKAKEEFNKEYDESGKARNSVAGLGHIMWGYCKALYYGVMKPSEASAEVGGKALVKGLAYPLVGSVIIASRSVVTLGQNFMFVGKTVVRVISPTVEAGFLASLSLFNGASSPVLRAGSEGFYAINQVAVTAATPVVGTGSFSLSTAGDLATHTAFLAYDVAKGTTQVLLNQTQAALVLGYNAITAIPTQLILGTGNAIFLLAWDGPRLTLYTLKGEVDYAAPSGLVLDKKKLETNPKMNLRKITDDPKVIEKVLEQLPQDLREKK